MPFPEFDPAKKKLLFFSRGRGRGHAIPDIEIVKELQKKSDDIDLRFVSYGTGARTIEEFGFPLIDLGLPEENSLTDTLVLAGKLIGWLQPDLVVSHEEFAVLPAAKIFDKPAVFLTDWFVEPERITMATLRYADEILFLDEPGIFEEPPYVKGKVTYIGPILRRFEYTKKDRNRAREELGLPRDAMVVAVLPGSWTEERVPSYDLVMGAFDLLDRDPKRLIWVAGADYEMLREKTAGREDILVIERDWKIERIMVACDVAVTKANRKTLLELDHLGIPTVTLSHGSNPIDELRASRLSSTRTLPSGETDQDALGNLLYITSSAPPRTFRKLRRSSLASQRLQGYLIR